MIEAVAEFFGIIGVDITPPETMSEFIPYFLTVMLAFAMVAAIFRMFRQIVMSLITREPRL